MKKKIAKPSQLDMRASAATKEYSHSSTGAIRQRQALLEYEIVLADARITEVQRQLAVVREEKARAEATLRGLRQVTDSR